MTSGPGHQMNQNPSPHLSMAWAVERRALQRHRGMFLLAAPFLVAVILLAAPGNWLQAQAPAPAKPAPAKPEPAKPAPAAPPVEYAAIRQIIATHCLSCHDRTEKDGDLVMETFAELMKGGESGQVIKPGDAAASLLVTSIEHSKKPFMPPPKKAAKLSSAEIALIRAWIDGGAKGPAPGADLPIEKKLPPIAPRGSALPGVQAIAGVAAGNLVAIGSYGDVELRGLDDRALRGKLTGITGKIHDLALDAKGARLAAAGGQPGRPGQAVLWEIAGGKTLATFSGVHTDAIYSVAISPDGKLLATGGYDQLVVLWNIADGKLIKTLKGHNGAVFDLSFRADGRVLASASADRTVKLWDVQSGMRLETLSEATKAVHAVAFSPDGKRLAAGGADNRIRVWRISPQAAEGSNELLLSRFAHEGAILRLVFAQDGSLLASAADDRTVKLWDGISLEPKLALEQQPDWPAGLAMTMDRKLLIVGRLDGSVGYYQTADGKIAPPAPPGLAAIEPRGARSGAESPLKLRGKNLSAARAVKTNHPQLTAVIEPAPKGDGQSASAEQLAIRLTAGAEVPRGPYEIWLEGEGGSSAKLPLHIDDLPQIVEVEPNDFPAQATAGPAPADFWGALDKPGDVDCFSFSAKAGQSIVIDAACQRIGGKANLVISLADATGRILASNNDYDGQPDPLIHFTIPADGRYLVMVREFQLGASADHFYRLTIGDLPVVTGSWPLDLPAGAESKVQLLGHNIPESAWVAVKTGAMGMTPVPVDHKAFRARRELSVQAQAMPQMLEKEPNDLPAQAMELPLGPAGAMGQGRLWAAGASAAGGDVDLWKFKASKGQQWVIQTLAARRNTGADTRLEILHPDGRPVQRLLLRAVRDTSITFRPLDAGGNGVRLVSWEEMQLNEYLYIQGEVVKLFLAPRGPDSEWSFYTLRGKRRCFFDTSPTTHPLDQAAYIVEPLAPGAAPPANGLPLFPIHYANDDDGLREFGADSRIHFTAPADGHYLVKVTDVRGFSGARQAYSLTIRPPAPDFRPSLDGANPVIPPGSGRRFAINVERIDEFEGPITVEISGLPPGFTASAPLVIEAGHGQVEGSLWAAADAPKPTPANQTASRIIARGMIGGRTVEKPLGGFGTIKLADKSGMTVKLEPDLQTPGAAGKTADGKPVILLQPGRETTAWLSIERHGHADRVSFDLEGLPHGVIVADIGLSGILIPEGQSRRKVFIQCAGWVSPALRPFHARAREAGSPASSPILLQVGGLSPAASK